MQIERVYKDSYGTVWMYATCNVRRTHNHKNKKKKSTRRNTLRELGVLTLLLATISAIIMIASADSEPYAKLEAPQPTELKAEINIKNGDDIGISEIVKPLVKQIEVSEPVVNSDEPEEVSWFIEELALSKDLQEVVFNSTNEFDVDYYTMLGLIQVESRFVSDAVNSRTGAYGLCQLNPKYFPSGLSDADNIREGTEYLGELIQKYQGDVMAALTAYNAGSDTGNREYAISVMNAANSIMEMANAPVEVFEDIPEELTIEECIGQENFTIGTSSFTSLDLPSEYYGDIDFSSFQPYEDYSVITDKTSAAYSITRSDRAYNDEHGLRRYTVEEDQFSINGKDDYVVALGTFYKPKGTCGQRYLIVTTTGYYTAIAGDEKSDLHTDDMHMFTLHSNGKVAGIIEWLVDTDTLNTSMKRSGNIATSAGPIEELKGDILYIYLIEE